MKVKFFPVICAALTLAMAPLWPLQAQEAPKNLISNGNFETDDDDNDQPDGWGTAKTGMSWESENGNRFYRLKAPAPGKMTMVYRLVPVPAGVRAVELSWKQRITDLKPGKQAWFDARIMMEWKDAAGQKLKGAPSAPYSRKNTDGWVERSVKFLVPEGAVTLEFMPSLFQVEAGTLDLDDIVLKETDAAPVEAAAKERAEAYEAKKAADAAKRDANIAKNVSADGSLFANGDMQADANGDGVPDKWGKPKEGSGISYEKEGDNRFLRLTSTEPFKMVLHYQPVQLPTTAKAIEITWKQRTSNMKRGKQNFHDARIMTDFIDSSFKKMKGGPVLASTRSNTEGWVEKSKSLLVADGAAGMALMPALFQVETGTLDLDDFSVKIIDAAVLQAEAVKAAEEAKFINVEPEAANKEKWPSELHIVGNKVLDKNNREVLLRGVNVVSLEWNSRGERVLRNTLVAIEDWKSNAIRLPVKEEYWFDEKGGEEYRRLVDNLIMLAANRGAYVLLDLHRYRAPKKVHADFWKDASARYKDHPAVIFDLFNEPHSISWEVWKNGGFVEDKNAPADEDAFLSPEDKALNAKGFRSIGMQALIDAARSTGAKNIVVVGGLDWAYDASGLVKGYELNDRGGNGIMVATHIYAGKRDWQGKVLSVADKYPIVVSEFGANTKKFEFIPADQQEDADTWVPKVFGFIQKHKFHYTAFSFHPGAAPRMLAGWDYTPTPEWGAVVKRELAGEKFADAGMR